MLFKRISAETAHQLIHQQAAQIVDIRDPASYQRGHISQAQHLSNDNLADFIQQADKSLPLLVYCYHGNSSQGAAQYLAEQGFSQSYSLDGGFTAWYQSYPQQVSRDGHTTS